MPYLSLDMKEMLNLIFFDGARSLHPGFYRAT